MSNITIYKKPQLAILEENKKLREYTPEETKRNCTLLVAQLLALLGIAEGKEEIHNALVIHISENYPQYSIEEISHAFNLFVNRELGLKVFKQLDAIVFGEVMTAYGRYKTEQLKIYRQNMQNLKDQEDKPSQEEQEKGNDASIEKMFKEYKKDRAIPDGYSYLYDVLFKRGKLPKHTPTYKAKIKAKAVNFAVAEKEFLASEDMELKRALPSALKRIESGMSTRVKVLSKSIVLAEYCERRILGL